MSSRKSQSGPFSALTGILAIGATPVAVTAVATQTGTFAGAVVSDVVNLSPRGDLTASIGVQYARVVADDTVLIRFANIGANSTQAAITFDVEIVHK